MMQSTNWLLGAALTLVATAVWLAIPGGTQVDPPASWQPASASASSGSPQAAADIDDAADQQFPVHVRQPEGPPTVELAAVDPLGRTGRVACVTCHDSREPNLANRQASQLDEFHQGLQVQHGQLACYACHQPQDASSLRAADGTSIAYQDVLKLCSQCHAQQADAFAHGAHGGMRGYWDRSRGIQYRNNCIDCHDPHAPKYPKMIVGFKPRDRFLTGEAAHDQHE